MCASRCARYVCAGTPLLDGRDRKGWTALVAHPRVHVAHGGSGQQGFEPKQRRLCARRISQPRSMPSDWTAVEADSPSKPTAKGRNFSSSDKWLRRPNSERIRRFGRLGCLHSCTVRAAPWLCDPSSRTGSVRPGAASGLVNVLCTDKARRCDVKRRQGASRTWPARLHSPLWPTLSASWMRSARRRGPHSEPRTRSRPLPRGA